LNDASGDNNPLRIIVGPTAAGKSALALRLAETFDGAIISADSRQIYAGFDIGTGKPTADERARVPHYGVDVASPEKRWSAATFAEAAGEWIRDAELKARTPVVVGGTGFWISALVAPLAQLPEIDPARRARLDRLLRSLPRGELQAWCRVLDPPIAARGHAQWIRAIETVLLTGHRLSELQHNASQIAPRAVRYLLVDPGGELESRIAARVDSMLASGWLNEVQNLQQRVPADAVAWKACGYEVLRALVSAPGVASPGAARDQILRETWQYARRQRTWFRTQLRHGPVTRLDPTMPEAWARATKWWTGADDA
jgi:tRNA dimethylallyltransferase